MTAHTVTPAGAALVLAAASRIAGRVRRTPLLTLEALPGVLLKAEHLQRGGSFKARGATNAMLTRAARRIVTGSSGNHGLAVATLGATLGAHVTIVMARGASPAKAAAIRGLGAVVVVIDGGNADRDRHARELARDTGAAFVPSADDELVIAGQGTVALEVFADAPDLAAIYVPTGGGGLLAGTCLAATGPNRRMRVVGVEPATARRYAASLAAGHPVELAPSATIADGLRAQRPGELTYPIVRDRVDDLIGVTDEAIGDAMRLLHGHGVAAEPSGCVALAGALRSRTAGRIAVVVSGGNTPAALDRPVVSVPSTPEG